MGGIRTMMERKLYRGKGLDAMPMTEKAGAGDAPQEVPLGDDPQEVRLGDAAWSV
jgi:hypothetical protein